MSSHFVHSVCVFVLLQFNPLLRDIFGLGPPLILDAAVKVNKISRFEKVTATFLSLNLPKCVTLECVIAFCQYLSCIYVALLSCCCCVAKYKCCCTHLSLLFFHSIFSTQLPSRLGLNRGVRSGTNVLTSCERRTGCIVMDTKWCLLMSDTQRRDTSSQGFWTCALHLQINSPRLKMANLYRLLPQAKAITAPTRRHVNVGLKRMWSSAIKKVFHWYYHKIQRK